MLRGKDGPMLATSLVRLRGISNVGILNSSWKEEKPSNWFQAVPNGTGYVDPPEEPTWSKNLDSAASMFPPSTLTPTLDLDLWGENFQDLSSWCHKPLPDTSSTMVGDRKGSSCIVQDDELNTPEIGVQREFNFTSPSSVLKEDTSSPYLSNGEGWEIPAPLYLPQVSSVEEDKSVIAIKKSDNDDTQSKPANEFFVDETWGLSVSHEEEIVSSHNQEGLNHEGFVVKEESDNMKTSVNTNEFEVEHRVKCVDFGSCESASKASLRAFTKTEAVENTNIQIGSLESPFGPNFNVRPVDNGIFSVHTNQQQGEANLSLKNLLSGSIYHSDTNVSDEIRSAGETRRFDRVTNNVLNTTVLAESQVVSRMKADTHLMSQIMESDKTFRENGDNGTAASILRTDVSLKMGEHPKPGNCKQTETAVPAEILANGLPGMSSEPSVLINMNNEVTSGDAHVVRPQSAVKEENVAKRNLKLNLATMLGTDEVISTPMVLESLFTQDEPFDLVSYVFDELESDTTLPASVEFDNGISTSCTSEITSTNTDAVKTEVEPFTNDVEVLASTKEDGAVNVMVVKPFVVESSGAQWSDAESEHMEVEMECNQFSSSLNLLGKQNQQFEGGTKTSVRRGLKGKDEHFPKVRRSRKGLQAHTSLESKISQDGPMLKLKISRTKPASSTKVLSSQKLSPRENISGLEELLLPKETRGRPAKRVFPSTSKEKSSSGSRSRRRKSSSSVDDESWTLSSKRSRMSSVDPVCDRYRELRDRNNEASRKSRQSRKAREREMKEVATKLERENVSLKIKADEMERLVKKLREALLEAVIKTKKV